MQKASVSCIVMIKNAWSFQRVILSLVQFILRCRQVAEHKEAVFFLISHIVQKNTSSNAFQRCFANFKNMRALTYRNKRWKLLRRHIIRWAEFLLITAQEKRLFPDCMPLAKSLKE